MPRPGWPDFCAIGGNGFSKVAAMFKMHEQVEGISVSMPVDCFGSNALRVVAELNTRSSDSCCSYTHGPSLGLVRWLPELCPRALPQGYDDAILPQNARKSNNLKEA
jgi:hypothetical protein